MIADQLLPLAVDIDTVSPYPGNPRRGDVSAIANSLQAFGQYRPIVVQAATGHILAGNHTWRAAKQLGWVQIAVNRVDVDDAMARRIVAADNRTAELGDYDSAELAALLKTIAAEDGLDATGYSDDDLAELLDGLDQDGDELGAYRADDPYADTDHTPDPDLDVPPVTALGQVWRLGEHRLLCGDARNPLDVEHLLAGTRVNVAFTSPPYADRRDYDETSGFQPIHPDDYVDWFAPVAETVARALADDGSWFINIKAGAEGLDTHLYVLDLVAAHVRRWGWHFATEFCWERTGVPKSVTQRFKNQFEPVYQFARGRWKMRPENVRHPSKDVPQALGKGAGDTGWDVQQGARQVLAANETAEGLAYPGNRIPAFNGQTAESAGHAAAFPVNLPRFFVRAYTDPGDTIYDPFCGTGSTLLAAHAEDRTGYGMELSPRYCDMICARFQRNTGITPVDDVSGKETDFSDTGR